MHIFSEKMLGAFCFAGKKYFSHCSNLFTWYDRKWAGVFRFWYGIDLIDFFFSPSSTPIDADLILRLRDFMTMGGKCGSTFWDYFSLHGLLPAWSPPAAGPVTKTQRHKRRGYFVVWAHVFFFFFLPFPLAYINLWKTHCFDYRAKKVQESERQKRTPGACRRRSSVNNLWKRSLVCCKSDSRLRDSDPWWGLSVKAAVVRLQRPAAPAGTAVDQLTHPTPHWRQEDSLSDKRDDCFFLFFFRRWRKSVPPAS